MLRVRSSVVVLIAMILCVPLLVHPASAQQAGRVAPVRGQSARLVLTEALRIGSIDGDDAFARVMDVKFGRNGRIYVLDDLNRRISVFDSTGQLIRRAGRQGQGPGEYQRPWWFAIDPRDSVFVWDGALKRVSVLGPDLRFVRSFDVGHGWAVNAFEVLPDGKLLVGAYAPGVRGTIHYLSRTGRLLRSFGPQGNSERVPEPMRPSLLGGAIARVGSTLVYSNKSPYELHFLDLAGHTRRRCMGDPRWTTRPEAVVTVTPTSTSLDWPSFVHSAGIYDLGSGVFLNIVQDLKRGRTTLDLVRSDCALLERRTLNQVLFFSDRQRDRLVGTQEDEYPEVVVYRYRVVPSR